MPRIGIIDHVGKKAGIDYYSLELAKGFVRQGVEVTICSNYTSEHDKITTHSYFPFFIKSKILQFLALLVSFVRSAITCRREGANKIIVHLFTTQFFFTSFLVFLRIMGLKLIIISHDVESFAKDDQNWIKRFIYNKLAYRIVVHNAYSYQSILKYCKTPNKISVIQQGGYINLVNNEVTIEESRKLLDIKTNDLVLLFFGQIKQVKRLDLLLKAAPLFKKKVRIIIAGKVWKDSFEKYQQLINQLDINHLLELHIRYIEDDEREVFMKAADIMILPYEEIFQSAVLLMGMSYGKVMITSDVDAFSEVIKDGINGLLFDSGNHESLALKVNELLEKPEKIKQIGSAALKTINKHFSWEEIAKQYIEKQVI